MKKTGTLESYTFTNSEIPLDVKLESETVWLSLEQMSELFDKNKSTISRHIKNIFSEGELIDDSVVANYATTALDGKTYQVDHYNLDVIISVGYRVKSKVGTKFHIWASTILKEYSLKGYEREFEIFSNNINSAARNFFYHKEIQSQPFEDGKLHEEKDGGHFQDSKLFQAMDENAQFWNDYKYSSIQISIIALGRIFDGREESHRLERLVILAEKSESFKKKNLRERKISGSNNHEEWIENYMDNAYELNEGDFKDIKKYASETEKVWKESIQGLRHKIYAHQEVLDDHIRYQIFKKAEYSKIEDIIQRLLTLNNIFWQAFYNGTKPDFDYKNTNIKELARKDVASLFSKLV